MTNNRDKPPEGHDGVAEHQAHAGKPIDRRNPPVATRFQPGQSGNPAGRPKGAKGRRKAVRDVLLEKREVRETNSEAPKLRTTLELLFMVLREKAIKGDRRAIKTLQDFDAEYNQNAEPPPEGLSFLVVPEPCATMEEWKAMYSPKDGPPNIKGHED